MITLNLPFHRSARVWFADLPQASFKADQFVERVIPESKPLFNDVRRVAVELLVPQGARSLYGLLGAQIVPDESTETHLKVSTSGPIGPQFISSIAHSDDVRVGLPDEYVSAVIAGVFAAKEQLVSLPSGELLFNYAAHGAVGSCELIFERLGAIVVKLLSLYEEPPTEQELAAIFEF